LYQRFGSNEMRFIAIPMRELGFRARMAFAAAPCARTIPAKAFTAASFDFCPGAKLPLTYPLYMATFGSLSVQ
jgi:hypothetical protein